MKTSRTAIAIRSVESKSNTRLTKRTLGVIVDSKLTFGEHISEKVRKANCIVGLIRRSFSFLDSGTFKEIYTAFVRPHLEYAQAVWALYMRKYINLIENVQIRATKLVDGMRKLEYKQSSTYQHFCIDACVGT